MRTQYAEVFWRVERKEYMQQLLSWKEEKVIKDDLHLDRFDVVRKQLLKANKKRYMADLGICNHILPPFCGKL